MKSLEKMMEGLTDPGTVEQNARYQNARDAVSWAWRIAQDKMPILEGKPYSEYTTGLAIIAYNLIPVIEKDLNRTLEILGETKSA